MVADSINVERTHEFFLHQNQLRKLKLKIEDDEEIMDTEAINTKTLLFLIIKNSSELVELEFRSERAIQFTVAEFSDFLNEIMRLESLNLSFERFLYPEKSS